MLLDLRTERVRVGTLQCINFRTGRKEFERGHSRDSTRLSHRFDFVYIEPRERGRCILLLV